MGDPLPCSFCVAVEQLRQSCKRLGVPFDLENTEGLGWTVKDHLGRVHGMKQGESIPV